MSDLTLFTGPESSNTPSSPPPRRSFRKRLAIGVACGVIGLGIVGTTAAFASQDDLPTPAVTSTVSPTPGSADGATPPAPADGATPPAPPAPGSGGLCAPGAVGGPGAPADGAAKPTPPAPADGAAAPTPPADAPAPPADAPAPPAGAPTPAPTGSTSGS